MRLYGLQTGVADRKAGHFLAASAYALASMVNRDVPLAELREASLRRGKASVADVDGSADCHFAARPRSSSSSIKGTSAAVAIPFSAIARPAKVPATSFS
jgi:hypothetical protein